MGLGMASGTGWMKEITRWLLYRMSIQLRLSAWGGRQVPAAGSRTHDGCVDEPMRMGEHEAIVASTVIGKSDEFLTFRKA
jgi:hypothetical protein